MELQMDVPKKPLGMKNYGSIPHLSSSRLGPSDRHATPGQEKLLTEDAKDYRVIVTEKLDGSNMGVARLGDEIIALGRAGYRAETSPYPFQRYFSDWVKQREKKFLSLLDDGERVAGEWLLLAHGTRYCIESPEELFVAFDILRGTQRLLHDEMRARCAEHRLPTPALLSDGPAISVQDVLSRLGENGFSGALDKAEGAVWRAEKAGECKFIAKFVHADKVDGKYLPEISGNGSLWNFSPAQI